MKDILNGVISTFKWKCDGMSNQLFYISKEGNTEVLHPSIEVKPADVTDPEKDDGYNFVLFACRTINDNCVIDTCWRRN